MRVAFFGDWHGAGAWGSSVIERTFEWHQPDVYVHTGDFGIWPGQSGQRYINTIHDALEKVDRELWFVDGNHEDFSQLDEIDEFAIDERGLAGMTDRIWHIPRGHRWEWDGVSFMGLGGAVSLDKDVRTPWTEWWPQETLTYADVLRALGDATVPVPVDVMVTHDAPYEVDVPNIPPKEMWPAKPMAEADLNRRMMSWVVENVKPKLFVHGHFHSFYEMTVGETKYVGLDCNPTTYTRKLIQHNFWMLDTADVLAMP